MSDICFGIFANNHQIQPYLKKMWSQIRLVVKRAPCCLKTMNYWFFFLFGTVDHLWFFPWISQLLPYFKQDRSMTALMCKIRLWQPWCGSTLMSINPSYSSYPCLIILLKLRCSWSLFLAAFPICGSTCYSCLAQSLHSCTLHTLRAYPPSPMLSMSIVLHISAILTSHPWQPSLVQNTLHV